MKQNERQEKPHNANIPFHLQLNVSDSNIDFNTQSKRNTAESIEHHRRNFSSLTKHCKILANDGIVVMMHIEVEGDS